jgi:hypothetical protein
LHLFRTGTISLDLHSYKQDWLGLDQYLDIPLLGDIINGGWEKKGDKYLHFYKLLGLSNCPGVSSDKAASGGHLETLKWVRATGGEWTFAAADGAAKGGHLKTLKWVRANGGEWTHCAADWVAGGGHLEILKWVRANGGEWTHCAAD